MPETPPDQIDREPVHAQLFMLRMWCEDLGEGRSEWRGKVQHVISGDAYYFRDWQTLIVRLQEMLKIGEV